MRFLLICLVGLVFGCGDGDRSAPAGPAGKVSADCSLAEIFSGKEGCQADPSLDVVPDGYVAPVDSTATADADTTETVDAASDSTGTGTETAPSDTSEPESETPSGGTGAESETPSDTSGSDPVVPDPVVIHVPEEEEPEPETARSTALTPEQARAQLESKGIAFTGAAFRLAAQSGNLEVVQLFVQAGMSLETADDYDWTALHEAAYAGRLAVVEYLVDAGANLEARDEDGWTVLMNAAGIANNLAVVRFLVESGADVLAVGDDQRTTAWSVAATVGNTAIADYLKSLNNAGDSVPLSPEEAAEVEWDWDRLSPSEARAALDRLHVYYLPSWFLSYARAGDLAVVKLFVWAGMSVDTANEYYTVLHHAANEGHLDMVKFLVAAGADVNATTNDGFTALHDAAFFGHLSVVEFLVAAGADVNATDHVGDTPRDLAAGEGHTAVVEYLESVGG